MKRYTTQRNYCRFCRITTTQTLSITKKRPASELTRGQRKFRRVTSGYGGFPRPKPTPKKQNPIKRSNFMLRCQACTKATHPGGLKARKVSIVKN